MATHINYRHSLDLPTSGSAGAQSNGRSLLLFRSATPISLFATSVTIRWSLPMNLSLPKQRSIKTRCRENQLYLHFEGLHRSAVISRLPRLISRNRKGPLSLLERLPVELLHHISTYLLTSSNASLALCSHYPLYALGTQHWERLRTEDDEREAFLSFFEKEFPRDWLCHLCAVFHLIMPTGKDPWP